jgi:hypothetical protein
MFADDTSLLNIFSNLKEAESTINKDLATLLSWSRSWMVKFNPLKTKFILISNKKNRANLNIFLDGKKILKVKNNKHLGIVFSEDFTWKNHIEVAIKKAKMKIGALFRTRDSLRRKDKVKLYTSMIRPALEYGAVIYDNCSLADSMLIESVQNFAARVCVGALKRTSYNKLCQELNWQKLETRRKISKAVLTYKILNDLTPAFLKSNFVFKNLQNSKLRIKSIFDTPKCRLTSSSGSFFPNQTTFFNNLKPEIIESKSLPIFRNKITKFLSNPFEGDDNVAYSTLSSFFGTILTQIRLGLSPLRQQLFANNLTDNPFCPKCLDDVETSEHFFLNCLAYDTARKVLFDNLLLLEKGWVNFDKKCKLNLLIKGFKVTAFKNATVVNVKLFKIVLEYIKKTGRFIY